MTNAFPRIAAFVAGAAFVLAPGAASAQDLVRIGTEGAYPPYNFTNASGELDGFEIELGNVLCERMGVECEFVPQDWDGMIPSLLTQRYDAIMAGMSITDERMEQIDFTQGYVTDPAFFVAAEDSPLVSAQTIDEVRTALDGMTVGVQGATIHQNFLEEEIGDIVDIRAYDSQENLNLDLTSGRIDAALADGLAWQPFLESPEGSPYTTFGPPLTGAEYPVFGKGVGIGLRKEDSALKAQFDQAITDVKADGTLSELAVKWFGIDIAMP